MVRFWSQCRERLSLLVSFNSTQTALIFTILAHVLEYGMYKDKLTKGKNQFLNVLLFGMIHIQSNLRKVKSKWEKEKEIATTFFV